MVKKPKNEKTPYQQATSFIQSASEFEKSRIISIKRNNKIAWGITFVSVALTALSIATVAFITPLKSVEPFVIRVDNNTGATDIVTTIKNAQKTYDEVIDKYWLSQYIRFRESYDWYTVQANYDAAMLLSGVSEQTAISEFFDTPAAPYKVFKEQFRVDVHIVSISWVGNTAQVRFEKTVVRLTDPDSTPEPTKLIATIAYQYVNSPQADKDRLVNPLGLQVLHYRVDPES